MAPARSQITFSAAMISSISQRNQRSTPDSSVISSASVLRTVLVSVGAGEAPVLKVTVGFFAARRPKGEVDRAPLRAHPAAQVLARVLDLVQGDHDIGTQGFHPRAPAEIGVAGRHQLLAAAAHGGVQAGQHVDALRVAERAGEMGLFQLVENGAEFHGSRLEWGFLNCTHY